MHTIPLIQGLRKTNQPIKVLYNTNSQLINKIGDDGGMAEIEGLGEYTS
jgi:hypothetical protein